MAESIKDILMKLDKETIALKIKDSVELIHNYAKERKLRSLND